MTELNPPIGPPPSDPIPVLPARPFLVRLVTEHNPFYLLSAACMLASCLALANSLSWTSIDRGRLLTLIVTLNVYEATLVAIALFLVARRRLVRDGRVLLVLQFFFLADFSFLNAEITTTDLRAGLLLNAGLFALAAVKLGVVVRVLKPAFTLLQFAFVLVELGAVYFIPCVLRGLETDRHLVGPQHLYAAWWVAGLLPAVYEVFAALDRRRLGNAAAGASPAAGAAPTTTYLALPYVSLLTHLGILHYVYDVGFYGAHAAPVLLGLAVVLTRFAPAPLLPRKDALALRLLLPLAAVLVSINNPFYLPLDLGRPWLRLTLTPLHLALAGAYLTYVYGFLRPHAPLFLATGAAAAVLYALGPSRRQLTDGLNAAWAWTSNLADRLTPKTVTDWGVLGLVASFVFLGVGLWVSLRKRPDGEAPDGPAAAPPGV